jgi:hypothetical protein
MQRRLLLAVAAAVLASLVYAFFFRRSDEGRIRKQIALLAASVRVEEGKPDPAMRALSLRGTYGRALAPRVEIEVPGVSSEVMSRDQVVALVVSGTAPFRDLAVDLGAARVEIDPSAKSARAAMSATVTARDAEGGAHTEKRDVTMRFENTEGEWRVAAISATRSD